MVNNTDDPAVVSADRFLGLTKGQFFGAILSFLVLCGIALVFFLFYEVGQNRKLAEQGVRAGIVLCSLKTDLAHRIKAEQVTIADERVSLERSKRFLLKNPNGIPGIPASLIKAGIKDQEKTIVDQGKTIAGQKSTIAVISQTLTCPVIKTQPAVTTKSPRKTKSTRSQTSTTP